MTEASDRARMPRTQTVRSGFAVTACPPGGPSYDKGEPRMKRISRIRHESFVIHSRKSRLFLRYTIAGFSIEELAALVAVVFVKRPANKIANR